MKYYLGFIFSIFMLICSILIINLIKKRKISPFIAAFVIMLFTFVVTTIITYLDKGTLFDIICMGILFSAIFGISTYFISKIIVSKIK